MKPILGIFLSLLTATAFANVGLYSSGPSLDSIVSRNTQVRFQFDPFVNDVDERDVTVEFTSHGADILSIASHDFDCLATSTTTARCSRALFPKNTQTGITLVIVTPASLVGGRITVAGTIRAASGASASWNPWILMTSAFLVTHTGSDGPGSLRDAIQSANVACGADPPCEIDFETSGTIAPATPLPAITARRISIDGRGEIILDGNRLPSSGLTFTETRILTVSGMQIQNWGDAGILLNASPQISLNAVIANNVLAQNLRGLVVVHQPYLYAHDNVIRDNQRSGVWIASAYYPAVYENKIEDNGASGVYIGPGSQFGAVDENEIRNNRDFGVAIDPNTRWIEVRGNSMKGNGQLGIDFNLDLVTPNVADDSRRPIPNAPTITSAAYDPVAKKTLIIGHVDLVKPADVGYYLPLIDLYASTSLDAHGIAQGEKHLYANSDYSIPVQLNRTTGDFVYIYAGDLRGQFISATYTRMYALGKGLPVPQYYENGQSTSEMSNPVRVE
jgi:hypothetical protein